MAWTRHPPVYRRLWGQGGPGGGEAQRVPQASPARLVGCPLLSSRLLCHVHSPVKPRFCCEACFAVISRMWDRCPGLWLQAGRRTGLCAPASSRDARAHLPPELGRPLRSLCPDPDCFSAPGRSGMEQACAGLWPPPLGSCVGGQRRPGHGLSLAPTPSPRRPVPGMARQRHPRLTGPFQPGALVRPVRCPRHPF